jgi:hypothetical protein
VPEQVQLRVVRVQLVPVGVLVVALGVAQARVQGVDWVRGPAKVGVLVVALEAAQARVQVVG